MDSEEFYVAPLNYHGGWESPEYLLVCMQVNMGVCMGNYSMSPHKGWHFTGGMSEKDKEYLATIISQEPGVGFICCAAVRYNSTWDAKLEWVSKKFKKKKICLLESNQLLKQSGNKACSGAKLCVKVVVARRLCDLVFSGTCSVYQSWALVRFTLLLPGHHDALSQGSTSTVVQTPL